MILLIDNYDSFVYNLGRYFSVLGNEVEIYRNDKITVEQIKKKKPSHIVLSPGPKGPLDTGVTMEVLKNINVPILGVCLGHQAIAKFFGAEIICAKKPRHGKSSEIKVEKESILFQGLGKQFKVGRYHSLVIDSSTIPKCLSVTSRSSDDGEIMSIEHKTKPIYGVQFHPESIISEHGNRIIHNFIKLTKKEDSFFELTNCNN